MVIFYQKKILPFSPQLLANYLGKIERKINYQNIDLIVDKKISKPHFFS